MGQKRLLVILLTTVTILVGACSGISVLSGPDRRDLYSDSFTQKINAIKETYRQGEHDVALQQLKLMLEETLLPTERASRRNLIGVILFAKGNYEQAIFNFDQALSTSRLDENLTSQIYLNLASCYYKLGFMEKAFSTLTQGKAETLTKGEAQKLYKLKYKVAKEMGKDDESLNSLFNLLSNKNKLSELKSEPYFEHLLGLFFRQDQSKKYRILESFEATKALVVGYIGYLEAEKLYYKGEKDEAKDLLEWVEKYFGEQNEIEMLAKNFFFRVENYAKINTHNIGIILPLSGRKDSFGQRALLGIDYAVQEFNTRLPEQQRFKVYIKDSKGSGAVGAHSVTELIEKNFVSVIIGGLFSSEATNEYLEAKKRGVFFISLSQIYLPKEQKDHLLLEIPGSIESQVEQLFSDKMLDRFGKRSAIIFPDTPRGEAYVNEFWRKARLKGVEVTGALPYEKNMTDFRDPVKNLLGLKFPRARKEELDLLSEIYSLEKKKSTRRIQVLKPQVDFDWIFIPAYPREALQIIPSFTYYDAFGLNIIGGPSWRSRALSKESYKLGRIHFIGDDVTNRGDQFTAGFITKYKTRPRIIEMMAYDSFQVLNALIGDKVFTSRDELDVYVRGYETLNGITGNWKLSDGVWMKKMASLSHRRGNIDNILNQSSQ